MLNSIYQVRGLKDCLKQGFNILTDRPWTTTCVMGPWALLVSLLLILYYWKYTVELINILINGATEPGNVIIVFLLYFLLCIGMQCYVARTYIFFRRTQKQIERREAEAILNEQKEAEIHLNVKDDLKLSTDTKIASVDKPEETEKEKKTKKALKTSSRITMREFGNAMFAALPYTIIIYILGAPGFSLIDIASKFIGKIQSMTLQIGIVLAFVIAIIALLFFLSPLIYTFTDALIDGEKSFTKNFRMAFHHKGKLFGLTLMSEFLTILICLIPGIPCWIALKAYLQSIMDCVNLGDPAFIPTFGSISIFFICLICLTVIYILSLTAGAPLFYLYGSIKTYEEEKEKGNINEN